MTESITNNPIVPPTERIHGSPEHLLIPEGWTDLIHGTDSNRWGAHDQIKHIVGYRGLSVVGAAEVSREQTNVPEISFATPGTVPLEVRIVLPSQDRGSPDIETDGGNIIKIGEHHDEATGRRVLGYVPDSFADSYLAAVETSGDTDTAELLKSQIGEA